MIELENVSRRYRTGGTSVEALRSINLRVERGELITVTGPSGSGKTTLLQILGTLDAPDDGTYLLEGHDITRLGDRETSRIRNRHFGFVFQSFNLLPDCTALENVQVPLIYAGVPRRQRRARAARMLETVGLARRAHHYPSMLSGGEQQRVAIARALVGGPSLVLADEPTGNLPSGTGKEILRLFLELHEAGAAFVIVTHDESVAACGGRRIHMEDGRIVG
jgi:putative ABC transport system ATP-binding protein